MHYARTPAVDVRTRATRPRLVATPAPPSLLLLSPTALPYPDPALTDGAVVLRPWRTTDVDALVDAGADPLVHRFRHSLPDGADEAREWLERAEAARASGDRIELAIVDARSPEPEPAFGSVSVWGFHARDRTAYVSYWLLESGRGGGRATAAVTLAARWAFDTLGLERLTARVETENRASQRVVERCGFRHEGTLRADVVDLAGRRVDVRLYGLLRGELA